MKITLRKFTVLFVALIFGAAAFSAPAPPPPQPTAAPPVPPGLPIDNEVFALLAFSVILACYKLSKIKKTST